MKGLRVLVVEDEGAVAMLIEDMLEELGCAVAGSAATLPDALDLVRRGDFDVALLDMNLAGRNVAPVAEELQKRRVPYVFASGYGRDGAPQGHDGPVVPKPFTLHDLERALRQVAPAG